MQNQKNEVGNLLPMTVMEGVSVNVLPSKEYEFLMTTKEVAVGYGISETTLRRHKMEHDSELIVGKHFTTAVQIMNSDLKSPYNKVFWTKRGIIRLGFFIKSERAKLFRDWAEELIVKVHEQLDLFGDPVVAPAKKLSTKRLDNRLDKARMIRLLSLVNQVSDDKLRSSIVDELIGGLNYGLYLQKGGLYDNA